MAGHFIKKHLIIVLFALISYNAFSQRPGMISRSEDKLNFVSVGVSYGQIFARDASFYGFTGEFSHRLEGLPFGVAASLMWDSEKDLDKNKTVNTFTAALTGSYLFNQHWSIGTGLGKGFADTDNAKGTYDISNGDWSTAIFGGYQLPLNKNQAVGFSGSLEYNISASEFSVSLDVTYGLGF